MRCARRKNKEQDTGGEPRAVKAAADGLGLTIDELRRRFWVAALDDPSDEVQDELAAPPSIITIKEVSMSDVDASNKDVNVPGELLENSRRTRMLDKKG